MRLPTSATASVASPAASPIVSCSPAPSRHPRARSLDYPISVHVATAGTFEDQNAPGTTYTARIAGVDANRVAFDQTRSFTTFGAGTPPIMIPPVISTPTGTAAKSSAKTRSLSRPSTVIRSAWPLQTPSVPPPPPAAPTCRFNPIARFSPTPRNARLRSHSLPWARPSIPAVPAPSPPVPSSLWLAHSTKSPWEPTAPS